MNSIEICNRYFTQNIDWCQLKKIYDYKNNKNLSISFIISWKDFLFTQNYLQTPDFIFYFFENMATAFFKYFIFQFNFL